MKVSLYVCTMALVLASCMSYAPTNITFIGGLNDKPPVAVVINPPPPLSQAAVAELLGSSAPTKGPTKTAAAALAHKACGPVVLPELVPPAHITAQDLDKANVPTNPLATSLALQNLLMDRLIRISRFNDEIKNKWSAAVAEHNKKCAR